jgi:hypothetical protein
MRTTVNLDDRLLGEAKVRAAATHRTLTATIEDALRLALHTLPPKVARRRLVIPPSGEGGLLPGVDLDDTADLLDRMEGRT